MGADDVGSVSHRDGSTGQRANETIPDLGLVQNLPNKGFARGSDEEGKSERPQICERPQHQAIPLVPGDPGLTKKSNPGVEHDLLPRNAGLLRARQTIPQGVPNALQRRSALGTLFTRHQNRAGSGTGNQRSHSRIIPQTTDIVDNPSARPQGGLSRLGPLGISRNRNRNSRCGGFDGLG